MDGIAWYHPLAIAADLKINFSIKSMTSAFCIVWSTDSTAYKHRSRATGNFSNKCQRYKKTFFLEKKLLIFKTFYCMFVHTVAWKTPVTSYKKVHTRYFVWNSSYKLIYLQFPLLFGIIFPVSFFEKLPHFDFAMFFIFTARKIAGRLCFHKRVSVVLSTAVGGLCLPIMPCEGRPPPPSPHADPTPQKADPQFRYGQPADGTHSTGMHTSCTMWSIPVS